MAAGYKDFTAGAVLTAADLEDYNQNQSIMRFASAAARDAALTTVKTEGMMAYLIDLNVLTVYSGAAWSTVGPVHGVWTTWTPTLTQGATPTFTINYASYIRIGRGIFGAARVTITGTPGTAANVVVVGLPVASHASVPTLTVIGSSALSDASVPQTLQAALVAVSTTTASLLGGASATNYLGVANFTQALATGDTVTWSFQYEAAADA